MSKKQPNKRWFTVEEDETIADCLARMREEGYSPIRRLEEPVFQENEDGEVVYAHQHIRFQGKLQ